MRQAALLFFLALGAHCLVAGEYAVLASGFRILADRHEQDGSLLRLYTKQGTLELAASTVSGFEIEEYVPPPPSAAQPAPSAAAPASKVPATAHPSALELIDAAAVKHGLRSEFVRSVAAVESGLHENARSPKGAIGLMQLMPGTAATLGANPLDPAENVDAGVRYLKQLLLKYGGQPDSVRLALAAYNAGPGAVDRHHNIPPFRETQLYVERVVHNYLRELKAP